MEARQITLNLVPGGVMPRIHCSQYDKGVPVEVTLYDGDTTYTVPEDATVYVQGAKLDGTLYQYECTASGSVVTFDLTIQMTVIAGENTAELGIYQGDDVVGTCNFIIDVEDSALQDPSQTSYNDIPAIADLPGLVADAQGYADTAQEAAQEALDAVDEIDLDMEEIRSAVTKASTSADLASGFADDAEDWYKYSKSYAVGDEIRAGSTIDNAMFYMNEAKDAAEDTAADVVTVEGLLEDIQAIETRTQGYANSASTSKTSTEAIYSQTLVAKTSADNFAKLSESWAHGQTGVRTGEDTDNAMYWANKAQAVAKTTVDSAFSTSSLNPVENRVITNQHVNVNINQQNGVHGLRYYNDVLEYYDTDTNQWVEIETGGGTLIVQPPVAAEQTYTYDGTEQTFAFSSLDSEHCSVDNRKKTAAGTYEVTVSLKESNYVWADDLSTTPRTFSWTINKATVAIPVAASQTYTYDGTQQTFAFTTTIDTTLINVTGNEQTNAGSYTVSCALVDSNNYEWVDSTTAAKTYSWTIAKAASSISVSPASITFDADNLTATLVPTTTGDGTVSYAIDKPSIATIAGNVVTATQTTGTATITATISETTNYTSASTTVSVTANFLPEIVAFDDEDLSKVKAMLDAHYAGQINIHDYWAVNNERTVTISAMSATGVGESHAEQTATIVLTNAGGKYLADGVTECAFQWDLKNCLGETGYMNSSKTNSGGWKNSARRTWCNSVFYPALPEGFRNCTKEFINQTGTGGGSSSGTEPTTDKIALRAEIEIQGTTNFSVSGEGSQLTYYATSANRVKKLGDSGSAYDWWLRSPESGYNNIFCSVRSDGSADNGFADSALGIAPCGCI